MKKSQKSQPNSPLAIAALILGVLSILVFFIPYLAVFFGAGAIVCGLIQNKKKPSTMNSVGLCLGIAGVIIAIVFCIVMFVGFLVLIHSLYQSEFVTPVGNRCILSGELSCTDQSFDSQKGLAIQVVYSGSSDIRSVGARVAGTGCHSTNDEGLLQTVHSGESMIFTFKDCNSLQGRYDLLVTYTGSDGLGHISTGDIIVNAN